MGVVGKRPAQKSRPLAFRTVLKVRRLGEGELGGGVALWKLLRHEPKQDFRRIRVFLED